MTRTTKKKSVIGQATATVRHLIKS